MRKIESKYEREKKERRKQIIIGIVLVAVMVLSTLGFALQGSIKNQTEKKRLNYNGNEFINVNDLWVLGNFVFKYNPKEVPNIETELKTAESYQDFPLYVYSESEDAEIEITLNMKIIAERVNPACLEDMKCPQNYPIKTCKDNFIIIKESNNSDIRQEENCVYIEGSSEELVKLVDEFLFKILGIK